VSRLVPANLCRGWVVVLAAALCLLGGAQTTWAAGCHVVERPALASKTTREHKLALDLSIVQPALAPPVLTHVPCPSEMPRLLDSVDVSSFILWHQHIGVERRGGRHSVALLSRCEHPQPPSVRLDRPPRVIDSCVNFVRPD
jgi:hypothetical protein